MCSRLSSGNGRENLRAVPQRADLDLLQAALHRPLQGDPQQVVLQQAILPLRREKRNEEGRESRVLLPGEREPFPGCSIREDL